MNGGRIQSFNCCPSQWWWLGQQLREMRVHCGFKEKFWTMAAMTYILAFRELCENHGVVGQAWASFFFSKCSRSPQWRWTELIQELTYFDIWKYSLIVFDNINPLMIFWYSDILTILIPWLAQKLYHHGVLEDFHDDLRGINQWRPFPNINYKELLNPCKL
jgi:hypothetical protein